jgi:hypothetical protein
MRRVLSWLSRSLARLSDLPDWLNWLLSVVEPLVVLGISAWIAYGAWCLVRPEVNGRQARILVLMKHMNDNWKAGLILLVLLFYRTVRIFLEQAEEAWGVKRPMKGEEQSGSKDKE